MQGPERSQPHPSDWDQPGRRAAPTGASLRDGGRHLRQPQATSPMLGQLPWGWGMEHPQPSLRTEGVGFSPTHPPQCQGRTRAAWCGPLGLHSLRLDQAGILTPGEARLLRYVSPDAAAWDRAGARRLPSVATSPTPSLGGFLWPECGL